MDTPSAHSLNPNDSLDPGVGPSNSPSDRVQPSGSRAEGRTTAYSDGSSNFQGLAPQDENKAAKRSQEDEKKQECSLGDRREIERLIADQSENEFEDALAPSSRVGSKSKSQRSPNALNDFSLFNAGLIDKVIGFMANFHLRTGAEIEPREAVNLVLQAGGDENLALERYLFTNSPVTPTTPRFVNSNATPRRNWSNRRDQDSDIKPLLNGRLLWPPKTDVNIADGEEKQREKLEEIEKPGERSEKKRGVINRLFGVEKTGQVESAEPSESLKR